MAWFTNKPDYAADGKDVLNNIVIGTGLGASATGLYYLAKKLRKRFEEQLEKSLPPAPDYADAALEVPNLTAPEQKKLAFDAYTVATPLATGAAGALLAAALSDKKKKLRNAAIGGVLGAGAGAALNTKPVHEAIGRSIPTGFYSWLIGGGADDETYARRGFKRIMLPLAGAAGVAGGKALYDISAAPYIEAEKKKEQYGSVESARQKYFDELLHDDDNQTSKKEKKSAVHDVLDAVYDVCAEKQAGIADNIRSGLHTVFATGDYNPLAYATYPIRLPFMAADTAGDWYSTALAAATTGGGLLGAKYMYDKTRSESAAKNTAKALKAKERMQHTLPVWIDPQELAQVKDVAKAKEQTDEGV